MPTEPRRPHAGCEGEPCDALLQSAFVLLALTLTLGLGAMSAGTAGAADPTNHIRIQTFTFKPNYLQASPGERLTVTNLDLINHGVPHTLTADNGAFDVGLVQRANAVFNAPSNPGRYSFHCEIHPGMTGILDVVG